MTYEMPALSNAGVAERAHGAPTASFHLRMAAAFAVIAFLSFVPSYWAKIATGSLDAPPIIHLHGALFFAWTLFYVAQTALVAAKRKPSHRAWGLAGIALFSVMMCTTTALGIHAMHVADQLGVGDAGRQFAVVTFALIALEAGLFASAIASIRRPEVHRRLMLLVMVVMMQPAIARWFKLLAPAGAAGPPPLMATIPTSLVSDLLLLVALVYDWRTRGRPHHVYVWGGALLVAVQASLIPLGQSAPWMAFARALQALMG